MKHGLGFPAGSRAMLMGWADNVAESNPLGCAGDVWKATRERPGMVTFLDKGP